jgi:hypothetical protein
LFYAFNFVAFCFAYFFTLCCYRFWQQARRLRLSVEGERLAPEGEKDTISDKEIEELLKGYI